MHSEIVPHLDPMLEQLQRSRGSQIRIVESISRAADKDWAHDRHFATRSTFAFRLDHAGVALSGTALTLLGAAANEDASYQIALDVVSFIELTPEVITLVERFKDDTERRSEIRFA